jgi:hypothetical protein
MPARKLVFIMLLLFNANRMVSNSEASNKNNSNNINSTAPVGYTLFCAQRFANDLFN